MLGERSAVKKHLLCFDKMKRLNLFFLWTRDFIYMRKKINMCDIWNISLDRSEWMTRCTGGIGQIDSTTSNCIKNRIFLVESIG